jgi:glycosyltransferase involved in cell wall biosynthesis
VRRDNPREQIPAEIVGHAPSISVVMPALNAAGTIEAAMESIFQQSHDDFELIVVDDGSTDNTADIVHGVGDSRLRLLQQDHGGAAAARNAGIRASRGAVISLVDSDDLLLPRYLEKMFGALGSSPEAGFAYTDAYVWNAASGCVRRTTAMERYRPEPPPTTAETLRAALIRVNFIYNAVSLPRAVFDTVGFFDESLKAAIDYEMWLRIAAYGLTAIYVPGTPLAVYRSERPGSISSDRDRVLTNLSLMFESSLHTHPDSADARQLTRDRQVFIAAELAALHGARTVDGFRRRSRDFLARSRSRLRSDAVWFPRNEPPEELTGAFPDLFPIA